MWAEIAKILAATWAEEGEAPGPCRTQPSAQHYIQMVQGNGKRVTEEPKAGLLDALGLPVA